METILAWLLILMVLGFVSLIFILFVGMNVISKQLGLLQTQLDEIKEVVTDIEYNTHR